MLVSKQCRKSKPGSFIREIGYLCRSCEDSNNHKIWQVDRPGHRSRKLRSLRFLLMCTCTCPARKELPGHIGYPSDTWERSRRLLTWQDSAWEDTSILLLCWKHTHYPQQPRFQWMSRHYLKQLLGIQRPNYLRMMRQNRTV